MTPPFFFGIQVFSPFSAWIFATWLCLVAQAHTEMAQIPTKMDRDSPSFLSLQSLCLMHTGKPKGVAVSLHNMVSDSANPYYVSDLLPQSFVGSS